MNIIADLSSALQSGNAAEVKTLTQKALDDGINANVILEEGFLAGMGIIGEKFKNNEVYVPEVMVAARAMNAGTEILKPYLNESGAKEKGIVVLGTVKGDLHDIGKNLVRIMMEGKGLRVIDLGVNVPVEQFVEAARENNADIIACSALLTTTMGEMKAVVEAVNASELAGKVRVMIGGAPVNESFRNQVGADGYAPTAADAADVALGLCSA